MLADLKAFLLRGNVLDLAVGVILGAAFGQIVGSLVEDIVMPPIGLLLGSVDFKDLFLSLDGRQFATLADARKAGAPVLGIGNFVNQVVNFLIVGAAVFFLVRRLRHFFPAPAVAPDVPKKPCPECTTDIPAAARRCPQCTAQLG